MKLIIASFCLFGLLEGHDHHHHDHDHESVEWTLEKSAYAAIQVDVAGPGTIRRFSRVSGRITPHPDSLAYVTPKVEGTVAEIWKNLGDRVERGDILAILESPQIAEAKSTYLASLSRLAVKEEIFRWETSLKGISAGQDYLQAKWAYDEALIDCECARQTLFAIGFTEEDIKDVGAESPSDRRFYPLKAPFEGRVLERKLTLGERADDHTQAFTIGNFDKVCVEMHIPQNEVAYIKEGLEIEIEKGTLAWVTQVSPSICEETRMARAIAVMENPSGKWSPGQYVNVAILTKTLELPLVVPREAVQKMDGESYLFVQSCDDHFEPCKVKLGKMDEQNVEIVAGLRGGESYVSSNAFYLKADFEKEELEHEH